MAYAIKKPWIVTTLLERVNVVEEAFPEGGSRVAFYAKPPKTAFVQLLNIEVVAGTARSSHKASDKELVMAHLSDKVHFIKAVFTPDCMYAFRETYANQSRSIYTIQGGVLALRKYTVHPNLQGTEMVAVVESFRFIGADGSPQFGNPQSINDHEGVKAQLVEWRRRIENKKVVYPEFISLHPTLVSSSIKKVFSPSHYEIDLTMALAGYCVCNISFGYSHD
jgi:hypothetical protein